MDKIVTPAKNAVSASLPIGPYIKMARPKQWVKNLFLFAPLVFAHELFLPEAVLSAVTAFFSFCCMASAVYVVNDIADVEADRVHPEKKFRPLASGAVPLTGAYIFAGILIGVTALLAYRMDGRFILVLCLYFLVNLAYSFALKNVVLLDVFTIASGFMMRVIGGAYAINVETSSWLVLCTLFISLFLGFAKRRAELIHVPGDSFAERRVLRNYQVGFLDSMLTIAAAGTVISYALYTVAPRTLQVFGTDKLIYTTIFVIYGVFRYLYLIHMTSSTDKPADVVISDVPILVTTSLWIISCVFLIYSR